MSGNRDVAKCIYPEEHGILTHVKQAPDRPSTSCEWGAKDRRESRVRNIEGCGIKKSCPCHSSSFVVADVYRICISESLEASWKKKMVLIRDLDGGRSKGPAVSRRTGDDATARAPPTFSASCFFNLVAGVGPARTSSVSHLVIWSTYQHDLWKVFGRLPNVHIGNMFKLIFRIQSETRSIRRRIGVF